MAATHLSIPEGVLPRLSLLLTAFDYAADCGADRWEFAVPLSELLAQGATLIDVRWLIQRGFAEHARETTIPGDATRSFRRIPPTFLPADMCVVLSQQGADAIRSMIHRLRLAKLGDSQAPVAGGAVTDDLSASQRAAPTWDAARRELRYRDQVVKRFRVPAHNQELILAAFHEEGWPDFIDDPLPPDGEQDPKRRLLATIKSLNRKQRVALIRFHGNGNGSQIWWEAVGRRRQVND